MASFLTRVELHNANGADYQRLHEAMEARKFMRKIDGDNGVWYHLPTAEYYSLGTGITTANVIGFAQDAVASINKTAAIITVEFTAAQWSGLARA